MQKEKPSVICLMGPTASGKTRLAMELIEKIPADIISVDSAMVYKGFDIGAAKPSQQELAKAPHRLIDIREPWQPYSASDFCTDATREINSIIANRRMPLLVGGTMLYFQALQFGLNAMPKSDPLVRKQLEERIKQEGLASLYSELECIDPESAQKIHANDPQRIQRALEVYYQSGKPLSFWQQAQQPQAEFNFVNIALIPKDRERLRQLIARRFDSMLEEGFIDEVSRLASHPQFSSDLSAARCVGYRQVLSYLNGELSYEEMREKAITATRQLAKRQLTWLKRWPNLVVVDVEAVQVDQVLDSIQANT